MRISIVDRSDQLEPSLREFAERRVRFALSRFGTRIRHITLVITDENGPRGGIDKQCRMAIKLRRLPDVVVTCDDVSLEACLARTAERAGRAVARVTERIRSLDRDRPSFV